MIYKFCCKDTSITDIYIGSTCNFHRRKACHKYCCNNENDKRHNLQVYKFIRDHGGFENWEMIMIEERSVENKFQKEKLEREHIERLKPSLNCFIPTRTKKEYYEAHKEEIAEKKKEYHEKNKEVILKKRKEYREQNKEEIAKYNKEKIVCDCGSFVTRIHKARHLRTQKHQDFINQQK